MTAKTLMKFLVTHRNPLYSLPFIDKNYSRSELIDVPKTYDCTLPSHSDIINYMYTMKAPC